MTFQSINEDKISKVTDDSLTFDEFLEYIDMNEEYIKMIRVELKKSKGIRKNVGEVSGRFKFFQRIFAHSPVSKHFIGKVLYNSASSI